MLKKDIYRRIRSCVEKSIKTRFDPIPGASLAFGKPSDKDYDEYCNLKKSLQVE